MPWLPLGLLFAHDILEGVGSTGIEDTYNSSLDSANNKLQISHYGHGLVRVYSVLNLVRMIYWEKLDTFKEQALNE